MESKLETTKGLAYSDIILDIVNNSTGIKSVELSLKVMEKVGAGKFDTEHFFKVLGLLIEDGSIIELEYVVPQTDYRIKSIFFPRETELRVIIGDKNESL